MKKQIEIRESKSALGRPEWDIYINGRYMSSFFSLAYAKETKERLIKAGAARIEKLNRRKYLNV